VYAVVLSITEPVLYYDIYDYRRSNQRSNCTQRQETALTRQLASTAAELILNNLENACTGNDFTALENMARASMLTGTAFAQSGLGAVHGLAHPLGSICNIPHGVSCAILLLPVLKLNAELFPELFNELARSCGFDNQNTFYRALNKYGNINKHNF
jgi:alcohol dehydrogenase class IV